MLLPASSVPLLLYFYPVTPLGVQKVATEICREQFVFHVIAALAHFVILYIHPVA